MPAKEQDASKGLGKSFYIIGWLIFLFLLTQMFAAKEENDFNPNQSPLSQQQGKTIEVKLQRNRYGHYVSSGKINGHDVTFFLDTGATVVSVPEHIAQKIGMNKGATYLSNTANGEARMYASSISKLEIGGIQIHDVRASINPNVNDDDILLGMSVLKHVEFTQKGNILILRQYQ